MIIIALSKHILHCTQPLKDSLDPTLIDVCRLRGCAPIHRNMSSHSAHDTRLAADVPPPRTSVEHVLNHSPKRRAHAHDSLSTVGRDLGAEGPGAACICACARGMHDTEKRQSVRGPHNPCMTVQRQDPKLPLCGSVWWFSSAHQYASLSENIHQSGGLHSAHYSIW